MKKKIILCLLFVLLLSACGKGKEIVDESGNKVSIDNKSNITINTHEASDGRLLLITRNDNKYNADLEVTFRFLNKYENQISKETKEFKGLPVGKYRVFLIRRPEGTEKYTIDVKSTESKEESLVDNITYTSKNDGECIVMTITNNSEKEIEELTANILYKVGEEILSADTLKEVDIEGNAKMDLCFDLPRNEEFKNIEFDSYEIEITSAK